MPTPGGLVVKKGSKDTRSIGQRDSGAVVGDFQMNLRSTGLRRMTRANAYSSLAARLEQRLLGVDHKIQHDLLKLIWVGHGHWEAAVEIVFD